jgi:threonylcarbamoyladenosine tRNA methylthiotransferase MtaB
MRRLRVAIETIGCRANQADSAWIARQLDPTAIEVVGRGARAEVTVVNSCAVTATAERDVRRAIHRARRSNGEDTKIILTGCMVTASPERLGELEPLWKILPGVEHNTIPALLNTLVAEEREGERGQGGLFALPAVMRKTRPSLRVQDGCRMRCAYCAVPAGRGPQRSLELDVVLRRLEQLEREGAREVVLCGINLGAWGRDLTPRQRLADLVEFIERRCRIDRLRLSSIEPWAIDERFAAVFGGCRRVAPHLHLPLQSGDDEVLRRMRRPYRARRFQAIVEMILDARPETAIGTDIIAGFPGETEAAFQRTEALLRELPLSMLHIFGFSPRPNTAAAKMPDALPRETIRRRVATLRALDESKRARFAEELMGQVVRPLIERRSADHRLRGVTGRFVTARVEGPPSLEGQLIEARVTAALPGGEIEAALLELPRQG